MVAAIVVLTIIVLGLLYMDRALLLEDAKKLEAVVIADIEWAISDVDAKAKAKINTALDKLKAKL